MRRTRINTAGAWVLAGLLATLTLGGCHTACYSGLEQQRQADLVQRWADENVVAVQGDDASGSAFRLGEWLLTASHVVPDDGEIRTDDQPLLKIVRGSSMGATRADHPNPADWAVLSARGQGLTANLGIESPAVREGECVFVTGIRVVQLSPGLGVSFGPSVWPARVVRARQDGVLILQLEDTNDPTTATPTTPITPGGIARISQPDGPTQDGGVESVVLTPVNEMGPDKGVSGGAVVRVRGQRVEPIGINTHKAEWTVNGRAHPAIGAVSLEHVARSLAGEPVAARGADPDGKDLLLR